MKKSLIALAALSAFATAAQAQSSVTVYGIIDTGYNSLKNNNGGTTADLTAVAGGQLTGNGEASSSRLGFRGTEDLGGGLKANFVIESGIGADATATPVGNRAFWVGLEDSKIGQLRIGRQDTLNRQVWLAHDQLAAANVAGNLAHSDNGSGANNVDTVASHTARNVAINYISPRFNGVQAVLGVTQNNNETTAVAQTKTGSGSQVGLNYVAGKFSAAVAYVEATTSTATSTPSAANAANTKTKDTSAAASYNLGFATVAYIYNKRDAVDVVSATSTNNGDRTSHSFSASVPLTPKLVGRLGYGYGEVRRGAATNINADIKGYQAALNYNLSKRTTVYGIYGNEQRDLTTSTKYESKEYSVGVRHSF